MCVKEVEWIHLAENKEQCWALLNVVMRLQVIYWLAMRLFAYQKGLYWVSWCEDVLRSVFIYVSDSGLYLRNWTHFNVGMFCILLVKSFRYDFVSALYFSVVREPSEREAYLSRSCPTHRYSSPNASVDWCKLRVWQALQSVYCIGRSYSTKCLIKFSLGGPCRVRVACRFSLLVERNMTSEVTTVKELRDEDINGDPFL
jgi:hypothetical protein